MPAQNERNGLPPYVGDPVEGRVTRQQVIITLVHGTWAHFKFPWSRPQPRWFEEDHEFRRFLPKFDTCVYEHHWSGRNRLVDRYKAAKELADRLRTQKEQHSNAKQLIIAHSHGGNVAFLALHFLDSSKEVYLATMGTPFVQLFSHVHSPSLVITQRVLIFLNVIAGFFMLSFLLINHITPIIHLSIWQVIGAFIGVVAVVLLINGTFQRRLFVGEANHTCVDADAGPGERRFYSFGELTGSYFSRDSEEKLLVLRGIDDEASFVLTLGSIGNRIFAIVFWLLTIVGRRILPILGFAFIFFLFVVAIRAVVGSIGVPSIDMRPITIAMGGTIGVFVAASSIPLICFLLIQIGSVFKSFYGRELLYSPVLLEVNGSHVPDTTGHVTVKTLVDRDSEKQFGLRHSLYECEDAAVEIHKWFSLVAYGEVWSVAKKTRIRPIRYD